VKRFPAYDPPEYVNWTPDPELVREYPRVWGSDTARAAAVEALDRDARLSLYAGLLRSRYYDISLKRWVRQGVISKAWLGTGEEAVTVGPVHALDRGHDVVAPMIRNAGACCELGMPVEVMFRGYLGTYDSPSKGRDGHVGGLDYRAIQPISNLGNMPPVAVGVALSFAIRREKRITLTWIGDGSVNSGPTHEAFNFAAVRHLPVVFIIQNNQVALGTLVHEHHDPAGFAELHRVYGCDGWAFDGNNVLDAYAATRLAAEQCRRGNGPVILTTETCRMGGHATHDEREGRALIPAETFAYWGKRDPIGLYEAYLKETGVSADDLTDVEDRVAAEVDRAAEAALASREANPPPPDSALDDVYAAPS